MISRTVTTKEELKRAKDDNADEINVLGKLAKDLRKVKTFGSLGPASIAITTTIMDIAIIFRNFDGGVIYPLLASTSDSIRIEFSVIMLAKTMGLSLVNAIFTGYEEIEFEAEINTKMKLRRKRK